MTNSVTYKNSYGNVYLDIKHNETAQRMFNNFMQSLDLYNDDVPVYSLVQEQLKEYHAVYRYHVTKMSYIKKHFIRFDREQDYAMFVLRWA